MMVEVNDISSINNIDIDGGGWKLAVVDDLDNGIALERQAGL